MSKFDLLASVLGIALIGFIALALMDYSPTGADAIDASGTSALGNLAPDVEAIGEPSDQGGNRIESTAALKHPVVRGRFVLPEDDWSLSSVIRVSEVYGLSTKSSWSSHGLTVANTGDFEYRLKDLSHSNRWFKENGLEDQGYHLIGLRFMAKRDGLPPLRAQLELQAPSEPQYVDVGEVRLTEDLPFVHGFVRDQDGFGVATRLSIFRHRPSADGTRLAGNKVADYISSDGNGQFVFYIADAEDSTYVIRGGGMRGFEAKEQVFRPFGEAIELQLLRRPFVYGTVLVDDVVGGGDLRLQVVEEIEDFQISDPLSVGFGDALEFRQPVPSGRPIRLEILTKNRESVYLSDTYTLSPGQFERPAEFNPLDLRGKLKVSRIKVQDSNGQKIYADVRVEQETKLRGLDKFYSSTTAEKNIGGELRIVHLHPIPELVVSVEGYGASLVKNLDGDITLTLETDFLVTVQIPSDLVFHRGERMRLYVAPIDLGGESSVSILPVDFNMAGKAQIRLPRDHECQFGLSHKGKIIARQSHQVHSDGQIITLHVSSAELAKIQ